MPTTLLNQILATTEVDGHGEQRDKSFLDDLAAAMPPRMVLNQHHEHGLPTVGYIENFRVESEGDRWVLKGDVTFDGEPPSAGGYSFSTTERVYRVNQSHFSAFLPFPYYRDDELLRGLAAAHPDTSVGKWIKKSLSTAEIALIISSTGIVIGPVWKKVYDEHVHQRLAGLARAVRDAMSGRGATRVRADYLQPLLCEYYESAIELYFVTTDQASEDVVYGFAIRDAVEQATELVETDWLSMGKAIKRIVFAFQDDTCAYVATTIIYVDGTARTAA
jgi:hypothetical protein